jgi:hypothetical protein
VVVRIEIPRTAHVYRWRVDRPSGILPVGNGSRRLETKTVDRGKVLLANGFDNTDRQHQLHN